MDVKEFINDLASDSPAPGGGSISAFCGSLSNALSSMVFNLTIGRKVFNNYDEEIQNLIKNSLENMKIQKEEFLKLMDKDTEAFMMVMQAFKLPKDNDENKKIRSEKIQESYKEAIKVPLKVAELSLNSFKDIDIACKYGNKNAITDAGVSCLTAYTSVQGAILNVKINLGSIKDENYKNSINNRCNEILKESKEKSDEIMKYVNSIVEG